MTENDILRLFAEARAIGPATDGCRDDLLAMLASPDPQTEAAALQHRYSPLVVDIALDRLAGAARWEAAHLTGRLRTC